MKTSFTFQLWKCILLQGFAFSLFLFPLVGSAQLPTSFQKVELITGLKNSINFEFAPDGRIFILDRYGELFIYKPNLQTTVSAGTLNVFHDMEEGLLAIAFDPNFTVNQYVYIHYSHATLPKNRVSRFLMNGDNLDLTSERVLLEWTSDRNGYFHAAGDMDFDSKGNLYIAIGDNSNHSQYAPLNETNANLSAERTSSNTNDFRGKILRIKPEANGTYTIPAGNLFPNGEGGLPEIYVMGARNPFKIFVDKGLTDWLFWGEVGPDADVASDAGPEGLDEINLTKSAGNYGWPYLSGANRPYLNTYAEPDFYYDKNNPVNLSKWNTGAKTLPPAQSSWLDFFHQCYLAGPRYYYNSTLNNPKKLPSEFNQAFFYFDFNQSKIWVVKLDATGKILSNQPFAPSITGAGFMDLKIGPDGQLYILEYGAGCCPGNVGSGKLVRLDYTGIDTNKSPVVALNASTISGPLPLTVNFSSEGTSDQDGDALTYAWDFQSDGTVDSNEPNPSFTFTQKLNYDVQLRVTDTKGATTSKSIKIYAGNTAATFKFNSPVDGGMISWEDNLNYDIVVNDAEDGSTSNGTISSSSLNLVPAFGHLTHSHDGITINNTKGTFYLDPSGHDAQGPDDIFYIFKTSYTDKGGLTAFDQVTVHPKIMEAEYYDTESNTRLIDNTDQLGGASYSVRALLHGSYVMLAGRNLKNIHSVSYRIASTLGGTIEVHRDSPDGPILSTVVIPVTGSLDRWGDVTGAITDPGGKHDLYFVFKKQAGDINLFDVNYIEFIGAGVSVDMTPPDIYSIKGMSKNQFQVRFNEALDKASAESISNYSVSNGISILSAVLQGDRKTVVFNTTSIVPQVQNVFSVLYRKNESGVVSTTVLNKNFTLDEVFIRINSGGPAVEVNGVQWSKSQFHTGGTSVTKATVPIDNTTSDVIYLSEVNSNFTYNIPVPQRGVYDVKLHFAELDYTKTGSRLFNVDIENGQYTLSNYDIFGRAGYRTAQIERFNGIQVNDGSLTIPFTGVLGRAKVNAIEVVYGKETVQKPNITITNPASGATVVQPFKINFNVNYWPIGGQTSHIHKIIDGVDKGDVITTTPITVDGLSLGSHTLKLALANADHSLTEYSHEIQINVASQLLCVDNPFPVKWTEHIIGPDVAYRSAYIYPVDINNDGFKDIVTGGWWYRNPGIPNGIWTQNIIGAPMNNMVLVHDLDKDGDLDIFGFQGKYLSSQMAWAQNDGKGNFIIHTNIPGGFPAGSTQDKTFVAGAAIGNYNGVENIQIALSWNGADANKLPVQMLTVPANPAATAWTIKDIMPVGVGESISAVDIDKDGDLDLFQGKNWLRNDNGSWTQFATGVTLPSKMERNGFFDLDRDGVLEAVVTEDGVDREISWLQIPTDPTKTWTRKVIGTDVDAGLSLDVVDFDFDGDLDVITGEWKNDHRLIAFENDICDSGTWIKRILHAGGATTPDHHDGTQTVDLDNDGDLDIISIGWDKRTPRIFVNGGGGATNQPPVVSAPVPDQSVAAGAAYAYTVPSGTFTDPDGDALTLSATQGNGSALPSWLTFSPSTRQLSGTAPASAVTLTVRLTASDGKGGSASDQFTLTVTGGGANGSPVVATAIPDQSATAGAAFSYAFPAGTFTDPDGDALSYSAALAGGGALPSWLSFSGAARSFSGTPAAADAGTLAVRVTASDGKGGSATDDFSLTVSGGTSSGEAYRYNAGGPQETTSRGVFAADAFASGGSKKSPTTDAIAGTGDDAIYRSNRFGTAFSYNIPVKGGEYQVVLHFADLYWTAAGKRVFDVSIEGSKVLSAYDIVAKAGAGKAAAVESFTVNVTDGTLNIAFARLVDNALVSAIEVISNSGGTANQPPVVSAPVPDQSVAAGAAYAYTVPSGTFTDPDGDALTLSATQGNGSALPSWLTFSPSTRQLSGTAPASAVTLTVRLTASDGKGGSASDQFTLTVTGGGANGSPVVATAIPDQSATAGAAFSYAFPAGTFTDPDGDALSYSAALAGGGALPSWLSFSGAARSFSGTPAAADAGTLAVRVTASDGKGGSATDDFSLTVSGGTSSGEAYRYNAGGPQETTSRGVFAADAFASGGSKKSPTTDAIAGTGDDAIYRSNRFGTAFSYNIPVKGGEYQVVLHFADLYWTAAGKRVFDVSIEGSKVLSAYDIVAKAGAGKAAAVESFTVNVTDGTLNIAFARLVDNALVSAIEVISSSGGVAPSSIASSSSKVVLEPASHKNLEARVHPNPFDENIYILLNSEKEDEEYEVKVYDVLGNTAYKKSFKPNAIGENEFEISLKDSQLSAGVYLLYVVSKDKSFNRMFKVLKKP